MQPGAVSMGSRTDLDVRERLIFHRGWRVERLTAAGVLACRDNQGKMRLADPQTGEEVSVAEAIDRLRVPKGES